jgi:hypothetical protein
VRTWKFLAKGYKSAKAVTMANYGGSRMGGDGLSPVPINAVIKDNKPMFRLNWPCIAVLVLMTALPTIIHAQTLTQAQAIQIAIQFSQAIGQRVTGTPDTVTYPAPSRNPGEQDPYWQPRWSIVFNGQAEFEVIDATGAIAWYDNTALTTQLVNNPPNGQPLTAATAVQIATAALKAAGAIPEMANTPSSSFTQITPGATAGDYWDVVWQRQDKISGILYPDQQLSVSLQGETGAIDMFGVYCPSPSPQSVAFTVTQAQAAATAQAQLQNVGVQNPALKSVQQRIVQPNTYWQPGGSWIPQSNVAGLAVWCCTFQDPNSVSYDVWVDAATGTVAGGQSYSMRDRAHVAKLAVKKTIALQKPLPKKALKHKSGIHKVLNAPRHRNSRLRQSKPVSLHRKTGEKR